MSPIRVFQCKDDCCLVRVPSKRFWYVETAGVSTTLTNFRDALALAVRDAELLARTLPTLEPTA